MYRAELCETYKEKNKHSNPFVLHFNTWKAK